MDEKEKQIIEWGKQNGKSKEETLAALTRYTSSKVEAAPSKLPFGMDFIKEIPGDIKDTFKGAVSSVSRGIEKASQAREQVTRGEISPVAGTAKTIGAGLSAGAGVVGEAVLGVGRAVLPEKAEKTVAETASNVAGSLMQTKPVESAIEWYHGLSPEEQALVDGALGIEEGISALFGGTGASAAKNSALRGASNLYTKTVSSAKEATPEVLSNAFSRFSSTAKKVDPEYNAAVQKYSESITKSFVDNNTGISTKLDELAGQSKMTRDELINDWASRGYVPKVQNELANFADERVRIKAEKEEIWNKEIQPKLEKLDLEVDSDNFADFVKEAAQGQHTDVGISAVRGADFNKVVKEIDKIMESYREKYDTDVFNPQQLREIQADMNNSSNAFTRQGYEVDADETIAASIRRIIEESDPSIAEANKKYGQLLKDEKIIDIFDNKRIIASKAAEAAGSFGGTALASTLGFSVGGPGGLVIAGIAARYGSSVVASMIRKNRFNPKIKQQIMDELKSNPRTAEAIIKEMSPEDQKLIRREMEKSAASAQEMKSSTK